VWHLDRSGAKVFGCALVGFKCESLDLTRQPGVSDRVASVKCGLAAQFPIQTLQALSRESGTSQHRLNKPAKVFEP